MTTLPPVLVELQAKAADFKAKLGEGKQELDSFARHAEGVGDKIRVGLGAAFKGVGAGVGASLTAGFAMSMSDEVSSDKLAAQLGINNPEFARDLGVSAANVYRQGFGDSIESVNASLRGVINEGLVAEDASMAQIEAIAIKARGLADTFDLDVGQAAAAAGQMIKTGLAADATQAFDIITRGFQQGVDKRGDFLDTLNEYGTQFRKLGFDGATATGLLSQGLKGGARDADLVADAFKEFSIRAIDGSKLTAEGFAALGLDASKMSADIAKGGPAAAAAVDAVLDRLRGMKDPVAQSQAAVALFGTQAEDLGAALNKLDPTTAVNYMGNIEGAADKAFAVMADNTSSKLDVIKRTVETKLSALAGSVGPAINAVGPAMAGFGGLVQSGAGKAAASFATSTAQMIGRAAVWSASMLASAIAAAAGWIASMIGMAAAAVVSAAAMILPFLPVILIIGAIGAAVYLLWRNWDTVWGFIKDVAAAAGRFILDALDTLVQAFLNFTPLGRIIKHWDDIVGFVTGLPGRIAGAASGMWDGIKDAFRGALNWIIRAWNNLDFKVPSVNIPGLGKVGGFTLGMPNIPLLARGGTAVRGGLAITGEDGPELVDLPGGASVIPLSRSGDSLASGGDLVIKLDDVELVRIVRQKLLEWLRSGAVPSLGFTT